MTLLCKAIGITLPDHSMTRLDALGALATLLVDSYRQPTAYALDPDGPEQIEALEEAVIRLKGYAEAQASLSCAYEPFAWRILDGEVIGRRWTEAEAAWWPKRFFARYAIVKEMRAGGALEQFSFCCSEAIASVADIVGAGGRRDRRERPAHRRPQAAHRARRHRPQARFELGKDLLNGLKSGL